MNFLKSRNDNTIKQIFYCASIFSFFSFWRLSASESSYSFFAIPNFFALVITEINASRESAVRYISFFS